MLQAWHTNLIAILILVALGAKWWMARSVDLTDFNSVIGLLSALGFIAAGDAYKKP